MEFSVVEIGYDQEQVDCCLEDLAERLTRLVVRADTAAEDNPELAELRAEIARLRGLLTRPLPVGDTSGLARQVLLTAEREAAEILARAREEARRVRDQVYAEAVQARRDFEAALHARRIRAERTDEVLRALLRGPAPRPDTGPPDHVDATEDAVAAPAS